MRSNCLLTDGERIRWLAMRVADLASASRFNTVLPRVGLSTAKYHHRYMPQHRANSLVNTPLLTSAHARSINRLAMVHQLLNMKYIRTL